MQEALGTERSVLALAGALVWVGTGAGALMGSDGGRGDRRARYRSPRGGHDRRRAGPVLA